MALAYLVRYNGVVFLVAIPLIILLRSVQVGGVTKRSSALIWVAVFVVFIAPWSIYLELKCGSFFYNRNYQNIAYEVFAKNEVPWDYFWSRFANQYTGYCDVIFKAPVQFFVTLARNAVMHLVDDISRLNFIAIGIPSIFGALLFASSHPDRRKTGLVVVSVFFFLVLLTVFYSERFSLLLIPMYATFFTFFFKSVLSRLSGKRTAMMLLNSTVAVLLFISYGESFSFNSQKISSGPNDMLLTRDWFKNAYGDRFTNARIVARKPHIAYLLDMQFHPFPMVDNYDSLLAVLRRDSVKFLYYGILETNLRPQFSDLLRVDTTHPGLKFLYLTQTPHTLPAVLYEVEDSN